MIISSAVLAGDRGIPEEVLAESGAGPSGPAAGGFEFGVDPSLDPELAMVRPKPHADLVYPFRQVLPRFLYLTLL